MRRTVVAIMAAICLGCAVAPASAQPILNRALVRARRACDGDTITAVDIRTHPPSYTGVVAAMQRITSRGLGLPHVPTRPAVIAAYMRLSRRSICTEIGRSESERLLRAQPFIASATIQAIRGSAGHVRLQVDVVDERRLIGGATTSRGTISSLLLGTENFSGRGVSLVAEARRGFEYRDEFGVHAIRYGMFGRPDFLAVHAERRPVIGERLSLELAEPFLTDLQRRAFHFSTSLLSGYTALLRPTGEAVSLFTRRTAYDVGWVTRVGPTGGRGSVGLVGAVLLGEDVRTGRDLVIVSDTGLIKQPANPFAATYPAFAVTRLAAVAGLRAVRFITAHGFDALAAAQDMGVGVQLDLLAGPRLPASAPAADIFVAGDFYAGFGDTASFVVVRALGEARRDRSTRQWNGVVASGRLAWYGKPSSERTQKLSIELSEVRQLVFPMQLTFRDPYGGLPGFGNSSSAGGERLIAHVEERRLLGTFGTLADFAVGVFATAGKLWAGDAPYGGTTPVRASAGITLLGAYPAGGKRTYRVDLAVPLNPEPGSARVELRFSSADRTRLLWLEPNDLAWARTGAVPVSLMKW